MKYLIFLIFIFTKPAFSVNDLEGRALICSYGKNLTNHEIYLFYKNSYASKYLFLENVPNLLSHNDGKTWEFMKRKIAKLNYDIDQKVLSPVGS